MNDNHKKKMIAPVIVTVIFLLYLVIYLVVLGIAMGFTLKSRIQEIRSGEDDDLSDY